MENIIVIYAHNLQVSKKWNAKLHYMDCEAEAIITRVYYEFRNGLEPSIDVAQTAWQAYGAGVAGAARQAYEAWVSDLVDEKEPSKEENVSVTCPSQIESVVYNAKIKNWKSIFN